MAKIFFYLNEYEQALFYALQSGSYFNTKSIHDEFTEILINKCIEKYIKNCQENNRIGEEHEQYKAIVDHVVDANIKNNEFKLPLGIALDTQDVDLFSRILEGYEFNELI